MAATKKVKTQKKGISGVSFETSRGKWRARISENSFRQHLGYYKTKKEAVNAVIVARS